MSYSILKFVLEKSPMFLAFLVEGTLSHHSVGSGLPQLYGLVIVSNFVGSSVLLVLLGTKVGAAREKYNVKLPELYSTEKVNGELTESARIFNCIQRGHQQALETYSQFLVLSAVCGLQFPVTTSALGLLWILARQAWADNYARGVPDQRYGNWLAKQVWTPLVCLAVGSLVTAGTLLLG